MMSRLKEETDQLTRQLITKITGFGEREENFPVCLQFVQSNFRFHRFLNVDSHNVTRQLEGLYTKLEVHSMGERAKMLRELVATFLQSPFKEGIAESATDVHYGLLSVLCLLAESPTKADYQPRQEEVAPEPQDDFDWTAHLMEGEDVFRGYYSDTSSEGEELPKSSDDDDREEGDGERSRESSTSQVKANQIVALVRPGENISMETTLEHDRGEDWLHQNIMVQYWKGQGQSQRELGQHASSNLLRDWTSYQVRSGEMYAMVGQQVVTEYQLVREVLWMLSGVDELALFQLTESGFRLKDNIRLSHLTGASLDSYLQQLLRLADRLYGLQTFVDAVVEVGCRAPSGQRSPLETQTFQAFADSLARVLRDWRQHLSGLERRAAQQDHSDCVTLSSLLDNLSPWRPSLAAVWAVFSEGVGLAGSRPPGAEVSNSSRASGLLTSLYSALVTQDSLGRSDSHTVTLLLRVLLETSRPYLNIMGQWISAGQLLDPANEFVLQRNQNIQCLDETFWERAFTLTTSSPPAHRDSSNTSLSSAGMCAEEEEAGRALEEVVEATPGFLRPVMRDVVLTGKSMELLQALGRLPQVLASVGDGLSEDKSLYHLFVDSLKDFLGTVPTPSSRQLVQETLVAQRLYVQHLHTENRVTGSQDHLLKINFQALFSSVFTEKVIEENPYDLKCLGRVEDSYVCPVDLLFRRCLYPHIQRCYGYVCSSLLTILKKEYRLMDYLHSMQHFYLMSAGDAMFDFYTHIFDKMRQQEPWRDPPSLTLALQEALQSQQPLHVNRLSISMESLSKSRERTAVGATDCIRLNFAVPWPVDLVVSSKCQNLYNQVFRFLLQIKRAKYGLDQLRFSDLDKPELLTVKLADSLSGLGSEEPMSRSERLHRLHVLRFRLAYFTNSLHNYIMTRILHSTGLEFADEMRGARDLERVMEVHARYVRTIHERCLLHKKLSFLKDAVTKVLNLTLTLAVRWDQGIHNISGQTVSEMEVEFSRCIQFLASFLNNIIKRGSFPHVEPLAFALVTSLPSLTKV